MSHESSLNRLNYIHIGVIALLLLVVGAIFISSIDTIPRFSPTHQSREMSLLWGYLLLYAFVYGVTQLSSLFVWKIAKIVGGEASLKEIRLSLTTSVLSTLPSGFFLLLFQFTFNHPFHPLATILDIVAFVGVPLFFIYGFVVFLKNLAQLNRFSLMKALIVWGVAIAAVSGLTYLVFKGL